MIRHLVIGFGLGVIGLAGSASRADEGMWPLYDLAGLEWEAMTARGLELSPEDLYDPEKPDIGDAAINIGGGSASFVSPRGLIITNHHVAFGALQKASKVDTNYIQDGFFAKRYEDEIPAIGYNAFVSLEIIDVTDRVRDALSSAGNELEHQQAVDSITKVLIKEAEKDPGVVAEFVSMFGGTQYKLYTYLKLSDVRIVHAPPASIGDFGGEIDNWMWPRHVGDYSFLRAYVGPDGNPADYDKKNVPYQPKSYLTVSSQGVREGDATILLGYPGTTRRFAVSYEVDETFNYAYPRSVQRMEESLRIIEEVGKKDPAVALRLSSTAKNINNYYKKTKGLLEGFRRDSVLVKSKAQEEEFRAYLAADPKRQERFGGILPAFDSLYRERAVTREKREVLALMYYTDLLSLSNQIYKWVKEREEADQDRDLGYQDRDSLKVIRRQEYAQINLVPEADKQLFAYLLQRAEELPQNQRIAAFDSLMGKTDRDDPNRFETLMEGMYAKSRVGKKEERLAMLRMTRDELLALEDPFIYLAASLSAENEAMEVDDKRFEGALHRLRSRYMEAMFAWKGSELYPDANGTKRFNFGQVAGYSPADAVAYDYITSVRGIMQKERDEDPFIVPKELREAWAKGASARYRDAHIGDVPVDFVSTNDGTNGNSGSPVLDGKGRLIGLDFDTNIESVIKDWYYSPTVSRAIVVDIRYVLYLVDEVYGLKELMAEMRIE